MNSKKNYQSDFLFSSPNFIIGAGSVLNIAGNYFPYNGSESGALADCRAIESDWGVIGQDIKESAAKAIESCKLLSTPKNG